MFFETVLSSSTSSSEEMLGALLNAKNMHTFSLVMVTGQCLHSGYVAAVSLGAVAEDMQFVCMGKRQVNFVFYVIQFSFMVLADLPWFRSYLLCFS